MSVAMRQARLIAEAMAEPGQAAPASEMVKEIVTILAKEKQQSTIDAAREIVEYIEKERAKVWDESERDRLVKEHAAALAEAESHRVRAEAALAERDAARAERDGLQGQLAALQSELATRNTLPMLLRSSLQDAVPSPVLDLSGITSRLDGIAGALAKPPVKVAEPGGKEYRVTVLARDGNGAIERIKYTEKSDG